MNILPPMLYLRATKLSLQQMGNYDYLCCLGEWHNAECDRKMMCGHVFLELLDMLDIIRYEHMAGTIYGIKI